MLERRDSNTDLYVHRKGGDAADIYKAAEKSGKIADIYADGPGDTEEVRKQQRKAAGGADEAPAAGLQAYGRLRIAAAVVPYPVRCHRRSI